MRASDTSEFSRAELNALLAQEAQEDEEAELGSSTVRLEADQLDSLLEKARQKLPPPRAQQTTQPYDQVTAFALLDKDHDDKTPTTPAAESAVELEEEPVIDVDEGEPIESDAAPAPAAAAPEDPPPAASAPLPLVPAATATPASPPSAALDWPDTRATSRRLRLWALAAIAGALAIAALLYFALVEAAPATSPAPPGEPASGETRPVVPAR